MTRGIELMIILAIVLLTLAGVADSPVWSPALLTLGVGMGRWAWVRADRDELLRLFG